MGGDFWHGSRLPTWEHKLTPFWRGNRFANSARDFCNFRRLRAAGWRVLRRWQHDVKKRLPDAINDALAVLEREPSPQAFSLTLTAD